MKENNGWKETKENIAKGVIKKSHGNATEELVETTTSSEITYMEWRS